MKKNNAGFNREDYLQKNKEELIDEIKVLKAQLKLYRGRNKVTESFPGLSLIKKYEKVLTESEEKYRFLFEDNPTPILIYDRKTLGILSVNKEAQNLYGYSIEEFIQLSILDIRPEEEVKKLKSHLSSLKTKKNENLLYKGFWKHKTKKGEIIDVEVTVRYIELAGVEASIASIKDVTKNIKISKALQRSEEMFRLLSESSPIGIFLADERGKPIYLNSKIKEITGNNLQTFTENKWFQIIHPKDFTRVAKSILSTLVEKNNCYEEFRIIKENGDITWIRFNSSVIIDTEKKFQGWVGTIEDISEQRNYLKRIKESEKRFRLLSEVAIEGIIFSENGVIIDVNDRLLLMLGYEKRKDLIGKMLKDLFIKTSDSIRDTNDSLQEYKIEKKNGKYIEVEAKGEDIPYYGAKIKVTVLQDITERKRAGEALRESEKALSNLMHNLPGMAYRCSSSEGWPFQYVSEGSFEITGYLAEQLVNKPTQVFTDLIYAQDLKMVKDTFSGALSKKSSFELEYRIKNLKGKELWIWEKGSGIYNENGELLYVEGFLADITLRKEYDKLIRQSRESYKNLIENSPVGLIIIQNENIIYANKNALEVFGVATISAENPLFIWDYILPEYHQQTKERMVELKNGNELNFSQIIIRNKAGKTIEIETNGSVIDYYGSEAIQTVLYDVSYRNQLEKEKLRARVAEETNKKFQKEIKERISAEQRLLEVQKFTRSIISSSLDMICATNKRNEIIEFNEAAQKIFGYTLEELKEEHPSILYSDYKDYLEIEKTLNEKGNYSGIISNRRKGGEAFTCYLSASILKNEEGEVIGSMGVSRDISANIKQEKMIYEQTAKLKSFFESSTHMFWTVNTKFELTSFNQKYSDITHEIYQTRPKLGNTLLTLKEGFLSEENYLFWLGRYEKVLTGKAQKFELEQKTVKGEAITREVFLNPIYDSDNNIIEIAAIAQDVTERKLDQVRIKNSLKEKEVLLQEVHHRVKNNLQVISSILNLQSSFVKDEKTLLILRESQNRIKVMAFIHESLYQTKDFSKINFSEYISNLSRNLIQSYGIYNELIDLQIDTDELFLNLDLAIPSGLIVNELLSNSLKYAFDPEKPGTVKIIIRENKDIVTLEVSDNGKGIPKGLNIKNSETLGLQLVTALCEQIDGTLEVSSKSGLGTLFRIVFNGSLHKKRF